ncbi:50S ribosomal protein L28 [Micromonospora chersina]|uniref:50S ribosomal protein L28 n=1 Tax=Micromonospora chersina TaxID=47854 RepID=UPI00371A3259
MSRRCDVCSKEPGFGNAVSRLGSRAQVRRVKSRTSRRWLPNLQSVRTVVDGTPARLKACTSCIKKGKVQRRART